MITKHSIAGHFSRRFSSLGNIANNQTKTQTISVWLAVFKDEQRCFSSKQRAVDWISSEWKELWMDENNMEEFDDGHREIKSLNNVLADLKEYIIDIEDSESDEDEDED